MTQSSGVQAGTRVLGRNLFLVKEHVGSSRPPTTTTSSTMIQISDRVPPDSPVRPMVLGAMVCIDMVLKE